MASRATMQTFAQWIVDLAAYGCIDIAYIDAVPTILSESAFDIWFRKQRRI